MSTVRLELAPPVAILHLDDGKANAFNPAALAALHAALDEIERSDARALVVVGRPGFFSGGLDLRELPKLSTADKCATLRTFADLLFRVFTSPVPTVAAVSGHAIAGGALLALACDVRFGVDAPLKFGITEVALGLPVPSFGLVLARAALPTPAVTDLAVHAHVISHPEGVACGVFQAVYPADHLLAAAIERAHVLAKLDGPAYRETKHLLHGDALAAVRAGVDAEVARFITTFEAKLGARR